MYFELLILTSISIQAQTSLLLGPEVRAAQKIDMLFYTPMLRALVLFTAACSALGDLPVGGKPNAIYDAQGSGRVKVRSVKNGVLYNITAPNNTHILEMHVYGTAYERGVAHGSLLATKVPTFMLSLIHI